MPRVCSGLNSAILALCLCFALAGEKNFWIAKPYTEWNEKEVKELLNHSPWSKSIAVGPPAMSGGEGSMGGARGGGGFPRGGAVGVEDGEMGGGGRSGRGAVAGTPAGRSSDVLVTWYSEPVRLAMARSIKLRNPDTPAEELDRFLNYPASTFYNILVIGWTAGTGGVDEQAIQKLREETFLEKKNKDRIGVADILPPQTRAQPLVLLFPKTVDGKPTVTLEDEDVTLRTKAGQSTIRAKFKLADMIIRGEPAL